MFNLLLTTFTLPSEKGKMELLSYAHFDVSFGSKLEVFWFVFFFPPIFWICSNGLQVEVARILTLDEGILYVVISFS